MIRHLLYFINFFEWNLFVSKNQIWADQLFLRKNLEMAKKRNGERKFGYIRTFGCLRKRINKNKRSNRFVVKLYTYKKKWMGS